MRLGAPTVEAFIDPDFLMTRFELISNLLCPYPQRAAIQLTEKGLPYERTYIDLAAKPAWFVQLSPLARCPSFGSATMLSLRLL